MISRACPLLLIVFILFLCPTVGRSEIYLGIEPYSTLADLKQKFPNGMFRRHTPAWSNEEEAMYSVTGSGISGTIVTMFIDTNLLEWKIQASKALIDGQIENLNKVLIPRSESTDDKFYILWVRWIPETPFSVKRLTSKYGKHETLSYSKIDYQPYIEWKKHGVLAYLSKNGKDVVRIDFDFTEKEKRELRKRIDSLP